MALIDNLVSHWSLEEASGTRVDDHGDNDLSPSGGDPGRAAATVDFESTYATERILELETLCDPRVRAAVDNADVTLVDFRSVGS